MDKDIENAVDPYEGIAEAVLDGPDFVDDPEQELPDSTPDDDSGVVGEPNDDLENQSTDWSQGS